MSQPYTARKMRKAEFKTVADVTRRDAAGALCGFAVEHESGASVLNLSWSQACAIAADRNTTALEAA